jgi:hypothetical protein
MGVYDVLCKLPVAINNYFGDPVLYWADTLQKVQQLSVDKHQGIVGIITKGYITKPMAKELKEAAQGLKLVVLVSISGLAKTIEPVGQGHRYKTMENLANERIPVISYMRPFIPPYNTTLENVEDMVRRSARAGCTVGVYSGFRGDSNIMETINPDKYLEWTIRLKLISPELTKQLISLGEQHSIKLYSRTSCGVAYALNQHRSHNPYYNTPLAVGCANCELMPTCKHEDPDLEALELLRMLGYEFEYISGEGGCCTVTKNRLECPSCCTSCFVLNVPRIDVKNKNIRLGDLAFIRFLTGVLASKQGVVDGGKNDVGHVTFPHYPYPNIHCINTWYVWANQKQKCFNCKYCLTTVYELEEKTYGVAPKQLANWLDSQMCRKGVFLNARLSGTM